MMGREGQRVSAKPSIIGFSGALTSSPLAAAGFSAFLRLHVSCISLPPSLNVGTVNRYIVLTSPNPQKIFSRWEVII